jgi:hypothetical protein
VTPTLAIAAPEQTLNWAHTPSRLAWSVMCYGGLHPRTGFEQPQLEVQFARRTRPNGYGHTANGILVRANDYAKMQHRTHFAVRGDDGLLYDGPVIGERDASAMFGRLTADMVVRSKGARKFLRESRHG